ncbi:MAG: hypothetical protein DYH12_35885 [Sorangiineae bacterium PRO1]|nr:hypothetical protein [Sorangiineae bacterium PRO1]
MTPREIRKAAGLTIEKTAVYAGVSSPTVRLFEADRLAVTERPRRKLDAYYAQLAAQQRGAA